MFSFDLDGANKGTFVKVKNSGWVNTQDTLNITNANPVGGTYYNTVSDRYTTVAQVTTASTGDNNKVIGMLLMDVRETDENGEKLIFHPRKAAELQCVVSGQTVPLLRRGVVLAYATGAVAGNTAYINTTGELSTDTGQTLSLARVGVYLGSADTDGYALLALDLNM
jgi:hypothetical protein